MVAGIWGNPNYDPQKEGEEAARRQILEHIEEQYQRAIVEIYTGQCAAPDSDEIDWDDPFFAASKAPRMRKPTGPKEEDKVARMLEDVDQT